MKILISILLLFRVSLAFGALAPLPAVYTNFVTPDYSYTQISNAVKVANSVVNFQAATYSNLANLWPASGVIMQGNGSTLQMAPGVTNALIMMDTNTVGVSIFNFKIDGGDRKDFTDPTLITNHDGSIDPYYQPSFTNRHGIKVNLAGGGTISGCEIFGFTGSAIHGFNQWNNLSYLHKRTAIYGNNCYSNSMHVYLVGSSYQYPGFPNAPSGTWLAAASEYQMIFGNNLFDGGIAVAASGANSFILANTITGNNYGYWQGPSNLHPGHGLVMANNMNHNRKPFRCEGAGDGFGVVHIINNPIYGDSIIELDNMDYVKLSGNQINSGTSSKVVVTNGLGGATFGQNRIDITDNTYMGTWGTDFKVITNLQAGGSEAIVVDGNVSSTVAGNNDGSFTSQMRATSTGYAFGYQATGDGSDFVGFPPFFTWKTTANTVWYQQLSAAGNMDFWRFVAGDTWRNDFTQDTDGNFRVKRGIIYGNGSGVKLATNTAPTGVTVGTTTPDAWLVWTNANGTVQFKTPAWINH